MLSEDRIVSGIANTASANRRSVPEIASARRTAIRTLRLPAFRLQPAPLHQARRSHAE